MKLLPRMLVLINVAMFIIGCARDRDQKYAPVTMIVSKAKPDSVNGLLHIGAPVGQDTVHTWYLAAGGDTNTWGSYYNTRVQTASPIEFPSPAWFPLSSPPKTLR